MLHDGLGVVSKVVGNNADQNAHEQADCGSTPDFPAEAVENQRGQRGESDVHSGGDVSGRVQRAGWVAVLADARQGDADDRGKQTQRGIAEYHAHVREARSAIQRGGHDEGCRHSGHVRIEQVGAHAGHVAHVVAHVIGDNGGVARIVFRDAQLDFTGQVGAHVRRFGKDTAARLGKQGQGAGTEGEAQQDGGVAKDQHHAHHAQQARAHNRQAHHCAAAEADQKRGTDALAGRHSAARVRQRGDEQAQLTRDGGEDRAADVSDGHLHIVQRSGARPDRGGQEQENQHGGDARKARKNGVFLAHKSVRAALDQASDFHNLRIARILLPYPFD